LHWASLYLAWQASCINTVIPWQSLRHTPRYTSWFNNPFSSRRFTPTAFIQDYQNEITHIAAYRAGSRHGHLDKRAFGQSQRIHKRVPRSTQRLQAGSMSGMSPTATTVPWTRNMIMTPDAHSVRESHGADVIAIIGMAGFVVFDITWIQSHLTAMMVPVVVLASLIAAALINKASSHILMDGLIRGNEQRAYWAVARSVSHDHGLLATLYAAVGLVVGCNIYFYSIDATFMSDVFIGTCVYASIMHGRYAAVRSVQPYFIVSTEQEQSCDTL